MTKNKLHAKPAGVRKIGLSVIALAMMTTYAWADSATAPVTDIGDVSATGGSNAATPEGKPVPGRKAPTAAAAKAITQAPLGSTSPQTDISSDYISKQVNPLADYGTIIRIAPSYSSSSPNGPGLSEAKNQTLRGFPDGQFNVTYDGLPFGDTNDFTHHTTSYFPAGTIGSINIDRSPGSADAIGYATFGGSINMLSPVLDPKGKISMTESYGSNATWLTDLGVTTGILPQLSDSNLFLNLQHAESNGALTNGNTNNTNVYLKDVTPIGNDTVLTLVYTYNKIHFNNPGGATLQQVAKYGYDYGLNNDPKSPNYYGYNYQDKETDFAYIGLKHNFGSGWSLENKLYTYYYYNLSHELNGDGTSSPVSALSAAKPYTNGNAATDIAGALKLNEYRTFGDTLAATHDDTYGTFTTGIWVEHTNNTRNRFAEDFTTGNPINENKTYGNTYYNMVDHVDTRQAFAEYAWKATPALTITPGIRVQSFERSLSATVNQNNLPGTDGTVDKTWNSFLPGISANYRFTSLWSGYAQIAKGTLAPNLNTMYSGNPTGNDNVSPQNSIAYQIGTVLKADRYTFDADVYLIDFNNYITKTGSGANATYLNAGGVRYTGAEVEGNVLLGWGFSFYANGSLNKAVFKDNGVGSQTWLAGEEISFVPKYTAAISLNYDHDLWHGSLSTKFVGAMYQGSNGEADGAIYKVGSYAVTSLVLARDIVNVGPIVKNIRLSFGVDNLFNSHKVTDNLGPSAADTSNGKDPSQYLYYFVPSRSFYVTLRAEI